MLGLLEVFQGVKISHMIYAHLHGHWAARFENHLRFVADVKYIHCTDFTVIGSTILWSTRK